MSKSQRTKGRRFELEAVKLGMKHGFIASRIHGQEEYAGSPDVRLHLPGGELRIECKARNRNFPFTQVHAILDGHNHDLPEQAADHAGPAREREAVRTGVVVRLDRKPPILAIDFEEFLAIVRSAYLAGREVG